MIKKEHLITTILTAVVLTSGFYLIDQHMAMQLLAGKLFFSPALSWDHAIPFAPQWVWVYLLYFPICFLPITFKEIWKNRAVFRRTALGFVLQFAAAFAFFWIFPSQMQRPIFEPVGISRQVLLWFYEIDPGFNIFPSLHVANVAYVACVAWKLKKKSVSAGIWAACFLIAASTLFVKQHYIFDLPMGALVGVLGYLLAFSKRMTLLDPRPEVKKLVLAPPPLAVLSNPLPQPQKAPTN